MCVRHVDARRQKTNDNLANNAQKLYTPLVYTTDGFRTSNITRNYIFEHLNVVICYSLQDLKKLMIRRHKFVSVMKTHFRHPRIVIHRDTRKRISKENETSSMVNSKVHRIKRPAQQPTELNARLNSQQN